MRFGCVGAVGSLVNLGLLTVLVEVTGFNVMAAYLLALESSIISNFFLNNWFTFRESRSQPKLSKMLHYNLVSLTGAVIAWGVFSGAYYGLGLHYILADALGIVIAAIWNFCWSIRLVWPIIGVGKAKFDSQNALQD